MIFFINSSSLCAFSLIDKIKGHFRMQQYELNILKLTALC